MLHIDLNGIWKMRKIGENEWIQANVPGSVYNDLLTSRKIKDPFYGENDKIATTISENDYEYQKTFRLSSKPSIHEKLYLHCDGLDTLAEITINGKNIGFAQNMYRTYEWEVSELLNLGDNVINVVFKSPSKYIAQKNSENPLWNPENSLMGIGHIRKAHYMFGWDWGPMLPDMGIWRNISINSYFVQRFEDVHIRQLHENGKVKLNIKTRIKKWLNADSELHITLTAPDGTVHETKHKLENTQDVISIDIENPKLWWPRGLGEQNLYNVNVALYNGLEKSDEYTHNIGLRTMTVTQKKDEWGKTFAVTTNGEELFSMGADYIPEDNILARCNAEKTEKLIQQCVEANFNSIRVWGGGFYPESYFYDLCDKYGILVWQDLMYACSTYDLTDEFKENITVETIQNIRRLRHHPSLALWCGNNEMEVAWVEWGFPKPNKLKADYIKQFEYLLPEIAKAEDPDTFYWLASPSSTGGFENPNDENYGDMHDWSVWHGNEPQTAYRKKFPRFMSEFGMQSIPSMKTVETFAKQEDLNLFSSVMENHQKCFSGNEKILNYIAKSFKLPKDFSSLVYVSQVMQSECLRYGVEHWRRNRGRCMGAVYWQLNDCWPVISWSSIDYYGRWKASQYIAKRFFAPVLLSANEEGTTVALHVGNETLNPVDCKVSWKLFDKETNIIKQSELSVSVNKLSSKLVAELDFSDQIKTDEDKRTHFLEYTLNYENPKNTILSGTVLFVQPKHFNFKEPNIKVQINELEDRYIITLSTSEFAKYVELDFANFDAVFSDNYFDISSANTKQVELPKTSLSADISLETLRNELRVRSLIDTY